MQTRSISKPFKSVCLECESHAAATRGCFSTCLVPEAEQLCQLNGALIWASVLVLSGDCIFAFGDKSLMPFSKKENLFAVCIGVEILFTDGHRGSY